MITSDELSEATNRFADMRDAAFRVPGSTESVEQLLTALGVEHAALHFWVKETMQELAARVETEGVQVFAAGLINTFLIGVVAGRLDGGSEA